MSETQEQGALDLVVEQIIVEVPVELLAGNREFVRLPRFSGGRPCPKCGKKEPRVAYHNTVTTWSPCYKIWYEQYSGQMNAGAFPEHLDRCCVGCHYEWTEAILQPGDEVE